MKSGNTPPTNQAGDDIEHVTLTARVPAAHADTISQILLANSLVETVSANGAPVASHAPEPAAAEGSHFHAEIGSMPAPASHAQSYSPEAL